MKRDVDMTVEELRDSIDQFDKAHELAQESEYTLLTIPIDELYDDGNYGQCDLCEEYHVLCPICGFCLKYCHDDTTCGIPCWPEDD
jgi:hypothetical protein